MQFTLPINPTPAEALFNAIWANAFTALANYTGWPIDYINDLLKSYDQIDNTDELSDTIITYLRDGANQKGYTSELCFYINTDDITMIEAYPTNAIDPEDIPSNQNYITYNDAEYKEHAQTIYIDPITGTKFTFFID